MASPELAGVIGVADNTVRQEVGVVEDVEHLKAQVECHPLGDFCIFLNTASVIDRSRSTETVLSRGTRQAADFIHATKATGKS